MDEAIDLGQERLKRRDVRAMEPITRREETCPTCTFPLADTAHGWVKEYRDHEHNERCARRHGYCLIPCPMCSGGVTAKRQAQMINDLFGDSHIPFYAKDWTFASFPGDRAAKKDVQGFLLKALNGSPPKRGLYLSGEVGKGKTSLAISALQFVIRKGHAGVFVTTKELFSILKESIAASKRLQHDDVDAATRFEATKGARLLKLLREVEWAVFDDLGVEAGSKYEIGELYLLLEARRASGLYTLFTSNKDRLALLDYWQASPDDARRIVDRLGEYCIALPVEGVNQRRKDAR
jgi:DNA replication protein DnaC